MTDPRGSRIGVLIVDDDPLVRGTLGKFVEHAPDLTVVGVSDDGSRVVSLVEQLQPDVVLMDVRMPDVDGLTATRAFRRSHPAVKILVITAFADQEVIGAAIRAGASGYLNKTAKPQEVADAIRMVWRGHGIIPVGELARQWGEPERVDAVHLTLRESQVLACLGRGLSNREMAGELAVTESTVKLHLSSLMKKLGVATRVQALARAHGMGLT